MNANQRQNLADELIMQTIIFSGAGEAAKTDPKTASGLAFAAMRVGQGSGFDFDSMDLTKEGFVFTNGS